MNYLRKHPKSGNWYFRRTIPARLRPSFGGKHDWNESLSTKSHTEAKTRAIAVAAKVEALFQQAREKLAGKPPAAGVDVQTITKLVTAWRDNELHRRATALLADPLGDNQQFQRECLALGVAGYEEALTLDKKGFDHFDVYDRIVNEKVAEIARNAGWLLTMDQPAFTVMWHIVRDAWVSILEIEQKWRNFDYANLPVAAPPALVAVPLAQGSTAVQTSGVTILEVYQNYAAERRISVKLRAEHATIFKRLIETVGSDVPICMVTKAHIVDFKSLLYKVPVAIKTAQRRLPIRELIAAFEGRDTPRLSQGSVIKNMVIVSTVFGWARDNGYLDANPVTGTVPARSKVAAATRRQPYSAADIKMIFASPIWTGCRSDEKYWEPGNHVVRDERYWLPILALFTGARLGELTQLLRADLRQEGDTWFIDITILDEEDQKKRLKTASSHRKVPLHPVLIRLGFLDYARPIQSGRMFPRLKPDRFGSFAESFGKLWARYCDRIGMADRRKVFHSFRHSFKDACRAAGLGEEVHDALTGHAGGGSVGRGYGNGVALDRLAQEIARIVYPSFPL